MKKTILVFLCSVFATLIFAQEDEQPYFQQEVNYDINVTLDDDNHVIGGIANIEYINNSPDALSEIYFHLWANAYQSQQTAYAKQQIQNGNTKFFFAKRSEMGGYEEVEFLVDEKKIEWSYDDENPDIALLQLNKKLQPQSRVQIRVRFKIKIPKYFSRMGHENQAYYISQWYPKPAVYDRAGWHPMPYLDMGEFYSEFGKFDVKITLPKNYVIAATGQLQSESEKNFLEKRVRETSKFIAKKFPRNAESLEPIFEKDTFPKSDESLKTVRFTAENVHDFAWFADKRFYVQRSQVQVGQNNNINTWAFFNLKEMHLWKDATQYLNQSVKFYSERVGEYPYPHATAVNNPYAGAGAMEYPMITLVDQMGNAKDLDVVIAHEIGHNWFYGILAFNERDFPWMDEGINSCYERLYEKKFYPNYKDDFLPKKLSTKGQLGIMEMIKVSMQRENVHQAITTPISEMTEMNYGLGVYDRTADILRYRILPQKMKSFYNQWKFKHPQPDDFIKHFGLENDKAFDELMNTTQRVDYKVISVAVSDGYDLKIKNKGDAAVPFSLNMILENGGEEGRGFEGFVGTKTIHVKTPRNGAVKEFIIDKDREIVDLNRKNNNIRTSGTFKKSEPFKLKFLGGIEDPTRTNLYWLPALGWNNYDKTMLGVVLHNNGLTPRNFEFAVAPMYGFASGNIVGEGIVKWNVFPESNLFQRITLSLNSKRYTYDYDWNDEFYDNYFKLAPKLEFVFGKKKLTSSIQHKVAFRHVNITLDKGVSSAETVTREKDNYYVNEFKYTFENKNVTGPLKATLTAHQGDGFLRIFANAKQFIPYRKKGKGLTMKAFAGVLPKLDNAPAQVSFTLSGMNSRFSNSDYMYDENLLGRSEGRGNLVGTDDGIFSQQIFNRDAGFKTLSNTVSSTDWMVSLGASTTLPGPLPIRAYFDAALVQGFSEKIFAYSIGIAIVGIPDALEIYIPIYENDKITNGTSYEVRDKLLKKITFLIDLRNLKNMGKETLKFY